MGFGINLFGRGMRFLGPPVPAPSWPPQQGPAVEVIQPTRPIISLPGPGAAVPPAGMGGCPPQGPSCSPNPNKRQTVLVDGFYSALPPEEVSFVQREARVPFSQNVRIEDGSGEVVKLEVPAGRTLLVSSLDLYADPPHGAGTRFRAGDLRGFLAFALLFDGRSPFDLFSEIDVPTPTPTPDPGAGVVRGSYFSTLGRVFGDSAEAPFVPLRAREGSCVRASYAVLRPPLVSVGHIGAILRGFLIPSALLDKKSP